MRRGVTCGGLVSALVMALLFFVPSGLWVYGVPAPNRAPPAAPPPPPIAVIRTMSELATTRVHISDIIEGENKGYRGRWSLHGECILGVDLSKVAYVRMQPEKREAVLALPPPHLISAKVDHERSEEIFVKAVGWLPRGGRQTLHDEVWKHADRKLQRLGQEPQYMERTRDQAERTLAQLFERSGWRVTFVWQDGTRTAEASPQGGQ